MCAGNHYIGLVLFNGTRWRALLILVFLVTLAHQQGISKYSQKKKRFDVSLSLIQYFLFIHNAQLFKLLCSCSVRRSVILF